MKWGTKLLTMECAAMGPPLPMNATATEFNLYGQRYRAITATLFSSRPSAAQAGFFRPEEEWEHGRLVGAWGGVGGAVHKRWEGLFPLEDRP